MNIAKLIEYSREFIRFKSIWDSRHTNNQFKGTLWVTVVAFVIARVCVTGGIDPDTALSVAMTCVTLIAPVVSRALAKISFADDELKKKPVIRIGTGDFWHLFSGTFEEAIRAAKEKGLEHVMTEGGHVFDLDGHYVRKARLKNDNAMRSE